MDHWCLKQIGHVSALVDHFASKILGPQSNGFLLIINLTEED